MDEKKVYCYQDREDDTSLTKSVIDGPDAGLYIWQWKDKKWKKLSGEDLQFHYEHSVLDPANNRVLTEEQAEKEIKRLSNNLDK